MEPGDIIRALEFVGYTVLETRQDDNTFGLVLNIMATKRHQTSGDKIWFPAKTYGYGWGPPTCWQGWVVMAVFVVLLGAGAVVLPPEKDPGAYLAYAGVLVAGLMAVCWWKGEKLRWRWGAKKPPRT